MLLCFDTETTGLPLWDRPSEHPQQPHICQLAAVLRSYDRNVAPEKIFNVLIKPDGWTISSELTAIHGITTERAMDQGIPINDALDEFHAMLDRVERVIGYNVSFDKRMMRIQEKRRYPAADDLEMPIGVRFEKLDLYDCMRPMTDHCQLPSPKGRGYKWPKLSEAYFHIYKKPPEGKLHDALTDIKAAMAIYWWLQDQKEAA